MKKLSFLCCLFALLIAGSCDRLPVITEKPNYPTYGKDDDTSEDEPEDKDEPQQPQEPADTTQTPTDTTQTPVTPPQEPDEPVIVIKHFSGGEGTAENPYKISNKTDLDSLAWYCNNGDMAFNSAYYIQTADISFENGKLEAIGNCVARYFTGSYDGQNFSITNVSFHTTYNTAGIGLFGYTSTGANIRNITLDAATATTQFGNSGAFVARMDGGSLSNCHALSGVKVSQNSAEGHNTGGIVGYVRRESRVSNCTFSGEITGECNRIGGISGALANTAVIENCTFKGKINSTEGAMVGGIVGWVTGGSVKTCTNDGGLVAAADTVGGVIGYVDKGSVTQSHSKNATVSGRLYVGGIAGYLKAYGISSCRVSGNSKISSTNGYAGGVVGYVWGTGVSDCHFDGGTLTGGGKGKHYFGGIAGAVYGSAAAVTNCTMSANATPTGGILGGIVGNVTYNGIVSKCTVNSSAQVKSTSFNIVGGVAGQVDGGGMVDKCWCCAPVSAGEYVGGIAGYINGSTSVVANSVFYNSSITGNGTKTTVGGIAGNIAGEGVCVNSCSIPTAINNGSMTYGEVYGAVSGTNKVQNCYGTASGTAAPSVSTLNSQATAYNATSPRVRAANWVNGTNGKPVIEGCPIAGGTSTKTKVALMGDSISTCKGWTPYPLGSGYLNKKEWTDITSPTQLYWYQIIYNKMSNAELDVNTAYSGTCVSLTTEKGHPGYSFLQRIGDLENPNIILICGGTNDAGYSLPIGEYAFDKNTDALDGYQFAQAYDKLIRLLKQRWPSVKIACIITDYLNRKPTYAKVVKDVAAHYSLPCAIVDYGTKCAEYTEDDNGDGTSDLLHPNAAGMTEMANQIWAQIGSQLQ